MKTKIYLQYLGHIIEVYECGLDFTLKFDGAEHDRLFVTKEAARTYGINKAEREGVLTCQNPNGRNS